MSSRKRSYGAMARGAGEFIIRNDRVRDAILRGVATAGRSVYRYGRNYMSSRKGRGMRMSRRRYGRPAAKGRYLKSGKGFSRPIRRPKRLSKAAKKYQQKIWRIANPVKAPVCVRQIDSGYVSSAVNKCVYAGWPLADKAQIETMMDLAKAKTTNGATDELHAPAETTYPYGVKLVRATRTITLRNNGLTDVFIEATHMSLKEGSTVDPVTDWANEMAMKDADSAETANFYLTSPLYNIREKIGGTPGQYRRKYREGKKRNVKLVAGGTATFVLKRSKPMNYSELMQESVNDYGYIKNVTKWIILRLIGNIGHDEGDNAKVCLTNTRLDYVLVDKYEFNSDPDHRQYKHYITGATTLDTVADADVEFAGMDFKMSTPEPLVTV